MASNTSGTSSQRVFVYGGAGSLGKAVVTSFKAAGASVESVDFADNPDANVNHIVNKDFEASLTKVVKTLESETAKSGGTQRIIFIVSNFNREFLCSIASYYPYSRSSCPYFSPSLQP